MKKAKKIIALLAGTIMAASAVAPITASAGCYAEDGTYFNYCGMGSYGVDSPQYYVSGYSDQTIGGNRGIYSGSSQLGSYQSWYNKEFGVYNYAHVKVFGSHTGRYYDGTVNCWGGWAASTPTKRAGWETTRGISSSDIYDNNSHTTWCGYCYWN